MTSKRLRIGVVGLGVGEQHVIGYKSVPGCEVVSVCDVDEAKLKEVADRQDVAGRHTDYRRVTEDPTIDIVSICTYDDDHAEHTVSALEHGKHVMIEKPIAVTKVQADAVVAAFKKSGRIITSNLILRASPRFKWLKKRVAAGEMGDIFYLEGDYVHQIGHKVTEGWRGRISFYSPIFGGGIHLIDLITWLHPSAVVDVCAMGSQKVTGSKGNNFDDTDVLLLRFADGTLAKVLVTLVPQHPKLHALRVYGTKASFVNALGDADWYESDDPASRQAVTAPYPAIEKGDLIPDFIAAIREGRQPAVNFQDVFDVMEICLAAQESRATGAFVAPRRII
jgi:predicted dehydrogenase